MSTKMTNRLFTVAAALLLFVLCWLALWALTEPVKAATLRIVPIVPTVPGIERGPSGGRYYRARPLVRQAPSAAVLALPGEAPPNGCPQPAFRVISGPLSGRGCVGAQ